MRKLDLDQIEITEKLKTRTPAQIAEEIGCHTETLRRQLRAWGIKRSRHSHLINETFFDTWSADMAYILGFTFADGSINISTHHYQIGYQLQRSDEEILQFIASKIQPNKRIYHYERVDKRNGNIFEICQAVFSSKYLVDSIMAQGCIPNKTYETVVHPDVPDEYFGDFVRGLFDGDGSISTRKKVGDTRISCNISCHQKQFLEQIRSRIGYGTVTYRSSTTPKFNINSKEERLRFFELMYSGNGFRLQRKFYKFRGCIGQ